jgi:hypothetical protein
MSVGTGMFIGLLGVTVFVVLIWGFLSLCECLLVWRTWFRDQFEDGYDTWHWHKTQSKEPKKGFLWVFKEMTALEAVRGVLLLVLFFIVWVVVEVLAIIGNLLVGLAVIAMVYSIATDFRNWWHKGQAR